MRSEKIPIIKFINPFELFSEQIILEYSKRINVRAAVSV
jgi:hypothetical protein